MQVRSTEFRLTAIAIVGVVVIALLGWYQIPYTQDASVISSGTPIANLGSERIAKIGQMAWNAGSGPNAPHFALPELRRMFDNHLEFAGNKSNAAVTLEITAEIDRTVARSDGPQAKRILGLYLEFRRELTELERRFSQSGSDTQTARNRLLAIQALRSRYFTTDEAQAMFGSDVANDMDAIVRREIDQDPSLTAEQKQKKLAALDASLPATLTGEGQAPSAVLQVEEKVYALRTRGGSDDDVYRLRAQEIGPMAAARLADSDREEALWTRRIAQYLTERNQILESAESAADPDHKAALLALQRARFTEEERSRLPVYEQ